MSEHLDWVGIDHIVLTVQDIDRSMRFYTEVLGATPLIFDNQRQAARIGHSKINFHLSTHPLSPHATYPLGGSADLCLLTRSSIAAIQEKLSRHSVPIEIGPVLRNAAAGKVNSIYIRDPDGNLIEIASPITG